MRCVTSIGNKWYFFLFLSIALTCTHSLEAQAVVAMKKYAISNSGCQVSLPAAPEPSEWQYDVDSNKVYSTQTKLIVGQQECHYAVHILQIRAGAETDDLYDRLAQYLDYIKSQQNIIESAGYTKGNNLLKAKFSSSLSDKWTDHSGQEFSVMGWAKGRTMAVLFVFCQDGIPIQAGANAFLNSFQFPNGF
ncbi:hypothetical protein [Phnomibacter ginsenosidimutans]|uniref:DUF1795 domain-containing protein n=1 Tax=Phnomibacter ginsenosidimutans TaxID=2676868 RepID=A0A6I6GKG9_9BACT|nr:hypothetical protein [Phnomibacter ginsenosidimutans]QGW28935.1 hypothetical protein GLV81_13240 [Phnomibacter ginsenosidimutans]